jgi:hypothetical protein
MQTKRTKLGKLLIIGDSYSTFEGCIPQGFLSWYPRSETDVRHKSETWWHMLLSETDTELLENNSFSGSTISSTERVNIPGTYFNKRFDELKARGFFDKNTVDTVIVFGGTNDSWIDSPIGEITYDPVDEEGMKCVLPAFSALLSKLKATVPEALIVPVINCDLKPEIMDGFEEICTHMGLTYVRLEGISKLSGHPSRKGMIQIKDKVLSILSQKL